MRFPPLGVLLVLTLSSFMRAEAGAFGAPIGTLPVGYRMEWVADPTRSWAVPDQEGHLHPGPRWIRVSLWYPAAAGTGKPMRFGEYLNPPTSTIAPKQIQDAVYENDMTLKRIYRADETRFQQAMNTPVRARSWADPANGHFPVIVHSVGQNDWSQDAVLMAEYLASQGFIVVSVPHLGTSQRRSLLFVHDPYSYETQLRDMEVALTKALKLTSADSSKLAATGHSYGGIYAMLFAMRDANVKAVVGLDPTYIAKRAPYEYDLRKFPFFDVNLRVPVVTLHREEGETDRALLDSLLRAPKLEIIYPQLMHGDFASGAFLERDLPDSMLRPDELKYRKAQVAAEGAEEVFKQVAATLKGIFSGQAVETTTVTDPRIKQKVTVSAAINAPTEEEIYWIYKKQGMNAAKKSIEEARRRSPNVLQESAFTTISKELGYSGKDDESHDVLLLTAFTFPNSVNAQLAAGSAMEDGGNKPEARKYYERALELDPGNQNAKESLAKLGKE
jgi:dienelactone hydrolase